MLSVTQPALHTCELPPAEPQALGACDEWLACSAQLPGADDVCSTQLLCSAVLLPQLCSAADRDKQQYAQVYTHVGLMIPVNRLAAPCS